MSECYCDYEPATFYSSALRKARKAHKCEECGRQIKPGESYERVSGMWDGCITVFCTCSHCCDIRQFVKNSVPCFCWAHGSMIDDASQAIDDAYSRAPDEVKGLRMGYLRLRAAGNRAWRESRT